MTDTLLERFWDKVQVDDISGCWNWTSASIKSRYGVFHLKERNILAHRFAYQVNKGTIPNQLTIDHLCKNTFCVNPEHLEVVTLKENILRSECITALNSKKEYCCRGHPLSGDNLKLTETGRECRRCRYEANRHRRIANQEQINERNRELRKLYPERYRQYDRNKRLKKRLINNVKS